MIGKSLQRKIRKFIVNKQFYSLKVKSKIKKSNINRDGQLLNENPSLRVYDSLFVLFVYNVRKSDLDLMKKIQNISVKDN
jgi:hypothetical protein